MAKNGEGAFPGTSVRRIHDAGDTCRRSSLPVRRGAVLARRRRRPSPMVPTDQGLLRTVISCGRGDRIN